MNYKPSGTNRLVQSFWKTKQHADDILLEILIMYVLSDELTHAHHDHITKYYDEIWRFGTEQLFGSEQT